MWRLHWPLEGLLHLLSYKESIPKKLMLNRDSHTVFKMCHRDHTSLRESAKTFVCIDSIVEIVASTSTFF